jgi:hypothetical protein
MRVFYPIRSIIVPASPPHEGKPSYVVSFGLEHWDSATAYVYKVQMAYGGKVSGRKSPSFPDGTDDADNVTAALAKLKAGGGTVMRGHIFPAGSKEQSLGLAGEAE